MNTLCGKQNSNDAKIKVIFIESYQLSDESTPDITD